MINMLSSYRRRPVSSKSLLRAPAFVGATWLCVLFFAQSAHASNAAYTAAVKGEAWPRAIQQAPSPLLRDYAQWRMLLSDQAEMDATELIAMYNRHRNWPRQEALTAMIEKNLFRQMPSGGAAAQWRANHTAQTPYGWALALWNAPDESGKTAALQQLMQNCTLDKADLQLVMERYGYLVNDRMREACIDSLLKRQRATQAEIMLPVDGAKNRLYQTRIAVIRDDANLDGKVNQLSSAQQNDAGLLADRTRWRHGRDLREGATELLLQQPANSPYAANVWPIRNLYAREAIERGDYGLAKRLLDSTGTQLESADLAEANWMRGWLELTFLKQPGKAFTHFQNLYNNVGYPVSLSRGAYWSARAAEAQGNASLANQWYRNAAAHPTTFYGQLAYAKLNPGQPLRFPAPVGTTSASFESDERFQLAVALLNMRLNYDAAPFIAKLSEEALTKGTLPALMQGFKSKGLPYAQVVTAKYGLREKNHLVADGWPRVNPQGLPVELGLLHAISRQESEFNPVAVSRADARGLMQLLPSTARRTADKIGVPYSEAQLFDPNYNMRLGSQYLGDLIDKFSGNYILAIAGYNAGPGRSVQWVDRFGRPGRSIEQTLTFMELIPFSETRNYVQRVLENLQVYRALFEPERPLALEKDLLR